MELGHRPLSRRLLGGVLLTLILGACSGSSDGPGLADSNPGTFTLRVEPPSSVPALRLLGNNSEVEALELSREWESNDGTLDLRQPQTPIDWSAATTVLALTGVEFFLETDVVPNFVEVWTYSSVGEDGAPVEESTFNLICAPPEPDVCEITVGSGTSIVFEDALPLGTTLLVVQVEWNGRQELPVSRASWGVAFE